VLLHKPESNRDTHSSQSPQQYAGLYDDSPAKITYQKRRLTKYILDYLDVFPKFTEMDINKYTAIQLRFQNSPNPSVLVTTPKVAGHGLNFTAVNDAVIIQKFCILTQ